MVDYESAKSSGLESWLWGEQKEWPPKPALDYYGLRQLIATRPLIYHAYQTITEGIRGASWRLYIESRKDIESWLSECIEDIWSHLAANAAASIFNGFAVAETWFKRNGVWLEPQRPVFPYCETVTVKVLEGGEYGGFKQTDNWIAGESEVVIPPEKSIHWVYGGPPHNDPYGIGALRVIQQYAIDQSEALAYAVETSFRHAAPITFVTIPQTGMSVTGADNMTEEIHTKLLANRLVVHKSVTGEKIEATAIQPPQNAVKDIMNLVDYDDRQIALGLLVALRTMYNAAGEGGSYNLVEVQQSHADQLLAGIIDSLRPGFERLVEITLTANGYPDLEFDFDVEKPSELTVRATRQMMVDLLKTAGLSDKVDWERMQDVAGLNVLLPEAEGELEGEEVIPAVPISKLTEGEKLARRVEVPPSARVARQLLDSYYKPKKEGLEAALNEGIVKDKTGLQIWVDGCIEVARDVYSRVMDDGPPVLSTAICADWKGYAKRLWTAYIDDIKVLDGGLKSLEVRGQPTEDVDKTQRENLARKLASKTMGTVFAYFTYLQQAKAAH